MGMPPVMFTSYPLKDLKSRGTPPTFKPSHFGYDAQHAPARPARSPGDFGSRPARFRELKNAGRIHKTNVTTFYLDICIMYIFTYIYICMCMYIYIYVDISDTLIPLSNQTWQW